MKKLIAILFALTLLTGAAFAQVEFSAELWAGVNLMHGNTEDRNFPYASDGIDDDGWTGNGGSLSASYTTSGGEAGVAGTIGYGGGWEMDGSAWWFPIPMLKIDVGGAGFDRGDATPFHYKEGSGNWFGISIIPFDLLTIRFSVVDDVEDVGAGELADQFGDVFMVQALINIPNDLGQIGLTFDNHYVDEYEGIPAHAMGIFVDYGGSIAGIGIDVGFAYLIGKKDSIMDKVSVWGIGLGLGYSVFGIDLSLSFDAMGIMIDIAGITNPDMLMNLGFSVGYSLAVNPFTIGFSAGIDVKNLTGSTHWSYDAENDLGFEWNFGISLGRVIDGFTFSLGVDLDGNNTKKSGLNLSVPIKFAYAW